MTYEVVFTKWRVVVLVAVVCCLEGLLFFGGVLVGVGLWQPTREEIRMAQEYRRKQEAVVQAAQKAAVVAEPAQPIPAPQVAAVQESAPAPVATPAPAPASAQAPAPALPAANDDKPLPPAAPPPFVLQVGSFRDEKNAKQLQTELVARGHQVTILNTIDSEQRMWHVVRIGRFQDLAAAAAEATRIGKTEQLQAMIRRGDRL